MEYSVSTSWYLTTLTLLQLIVHEGMESTTAQLAFVYNIMVPLVTFFQRFQRVTVRKLPRHHHQNLR